MLNISKIIVNADIIVDIQRHYNSPLGFLKKAKQMIIDRHLLIGMWAPGSAASWDKKKKNCRTKSETKIHKKPQMITE